MREPVILDSSDLRRRLLRTFDVAQRAVRVLGESGYRADDEPEGSFGPDKLLAETAMLLHVASALDDDVELKRRVDDLASLIVPHARAQRVAIAIALHPSICLQLAMPHILLDRLGVPDVRFDRLLQHGLDGSAALGREVVPHRGDGTHVAADAVVRWRNAS